MIKEALFTFAARVFFAGLTLVTTIVTAKFLGLEGRGIYYFLLTVTNISVLVFGLGIGSANTYFGGKKEIPANILFGNSIFASLVLGLAASGVMLTIFFFFPGFFKGVDETLLIIACISIFFQLAGKFIFGLLLGEKKIYSYNYIQVSVSLLNIVLFLIFFSIFKNLNAAVFILLVLMNFQLFFWGAFALFGKKSKLSLSKIAVDWQSEKKTILFGLKGQIGDILQFFNYRLGVFFVNFFIHPMAVGIYSIAIVLAEALWFFSGSLAVVLFSKVANSNDPIESEILTNQSCRVSFLIVSAGGVLLFLLAPFAIQILFGSEYLGAVYPLRILLPGIVIFSVSNVLASHLTGSGFPQYNTFASLFSLMLTISLNIILIPKWGINGAALSSSISYIFSTLLTIFFYKKKLVKPVTFRELLLVNGNDVRKGSAIFDSLKSKIYLLAKKPTNKKS